MHDVHLSPIFFFYSNVQFVLGVPHNFLPVLTCLNVFLSPDLIYFVSGI